MTVEETIAATLSRTSEFGVKYPGSVSSLIRRLNQRQMEIYALGNQWNPDYFGVCAIANVETGMVDLRDIEPPLYWMDGITKIEIHDAGSSDYEEHETVNVVSLDDLEAAFPPRVTLRDMLVQQAHEDLEGVVSLEFHYPKSPHQLPTAPDTWAAHELELPRQYQELLVIDLAREVFRRAVHLGDARTELIKLMNEDEAPLIENFQGHVVRFAGSQIQRFATRTTIAAP